MTDLAIRVEGLGKRYRIGGPRARYKTLRESVIDTLRSAFQRSNVPTFERSNTIWALRDVSFEVKQGEVLGIIGRNGAGKSTLLKILSRITEPTEGWAETFGRVGSLLEVGTGFHPELTGRENIFLNGTILGMRRAEIQSKLDEIVEFSGVEKFIDTPVKHYSSGMYVRLAFAVAAHLEPEILFVDEVLAVGDAAFQEKCLGKMSEVAGGGRTVLFVSHNMAAVRNLCSRAILLDQGHIVCAGTAPEVITKYLNLNRSTVALPLRDRQDRVGNGRLRFTEVALLDAHSRILEYAVSGQEVTLALSYESKGDVSSALNPTVQIAFTGLYGQPLFACLSRVSAEPLKSLGPKGRILCRIPRLPLMPGVYSFSLWCKLNDDVTDWLLHAGTLKVFAGDFYGSGRLPAAQTGEILVDHQWAVEA